MSRAVGTWRCGLAVVGVALLGFLGAGVSGAEPTPGMVRSEFIYDRGPYPSCHASTLVETSDGALLAAWFGGSFESRPDVCIYLSRYEDGRWTPGVEVANGVENATTRYPCWNPVLFQAREGPLLLFYKVGPSPAGWWGMVKTSTDGGRTWSEPRRLPDGVLGPIKNKPVQLADGTLVCGSSTESPQDGWQVQIERTTDLGRSWEVVGPLNTKAEFNAIQPSILTHADGRLQLLGRTQERVIVTSWSSDAGKSWSRLAATELLSPNSGSDAVTLADGRQLLVYNPRDARSAAAAASGGERDRCPLALALSDDGIHWKRVATLENEPRPHGYAYPAVIQTRDGLVHVTYTWDRRKIKHAVLDPRRL